MKMEQINYTEKDLQITRNHAELIKTATAYDNRFKSNCSPAKHLLCHLVTFGYNTANYNLMQEHRRTLSGLVYCEAASIHQVMSEEFELAFKNNNTVVADLSSLFGLNPTSHTWADIEMFKHSKHINSIFIATEVIPSNLGFNNTILKYRGYIQNDMEVIKSIRAKINFENILLIIDGLKDIETAKRVIVDIPNIIPGIPEIKKLVKYEIKNKEYAFEGAINTLISRLNTNKESAFTCRPDDEKFLLQRFTDFEDPLNISRRVEEAIIKLDKILSTIKL